MNQTPLAHALLLVLAFAVGAARPSAAQTGSPGDPRVQAVRPAALKDGASAQEFERYYLGEYAPRLEAAVPGLRASLLRGDRGEKRGQYLIVWEFDSASLRDSYFPAPEGAASPRLQELVRSMPPSRLSEYVQISGYTDYLVLR